MTVEGVSTLNLLRIENWLVNEMERVPSSPTRQSDFDIFRGKGLPNRRVEGWRWTDIESALDGETIDGSLAEDPFKDVEALRIRVSESSEVDQNQSVENVKVSAIDARPSLEVRDNSSLVPLTRALASTAGNAGVLSIEVSGNSEVPVHLVFASSGKQGSFNRVKVSIAPDASVEIIESHLGGSHFSSALMEFDVQEGGSLTRTVFQSGSTEQVQYLNAMVQLHAGAKFNQTSLAFGSKLTRLETNVVYQEEHAEARLNAAYVVGDGKHVDFTTDIHHSAQYCKTNQQTKGAVMNGGTGVFQGKFLVPKDKGQHTDANMQHHALLLGERAQVFAKPELEIYADDVVCAHGNTSGSMDSKQVFYLRQRGIPESMAREILTRAFLSTAIDNASQITRESLLSKLDNSLRYF